MNRLFAAIVLLSVSLVGCSTALIPNTDVESTAENREIIEFCERYRHAVEERDVAAIVSLASPTYFDDNGTPSGDDDIDLDGLREKLTRWSGEVLSVRHEMHYRHVTVNEGKIYVDYRFSGQYRLRTSTGDRWSRRIADNRIVLRRENDELRIIAGM